MTRSWCSLVVVLGVLCEPRASNGQPLERATGIELGVDAGVGIVRTQGTPLSPGPAALLHAGYRLGNGLIPELAVGAAHFTATNLRATALVAMPGVRFSRLVDRYYTGVGAHVGLGHLTASSGGASISAKGLAIELGFDLGYQVRRNLVLGPHFGLHKVVVEKDGAVEVGELWFQLGLGVSWTVPP